MIRPNTPARPMSGPEAEALVARFGLRVAARLGEGAEQINPDIAERLRFAREQAVQRARQRQTGLATAGSARAQAQGRSLVMEGGPADGVFGSWWMRLGMVLPLVVLVVGLLAIQHFTEQEDAALLAQLDSELLSDDLPPDAYADPGFTEYLRATGTSGPL